MKTDSGYFKNADGCNIFHQSWLPDGDVKARVFIVHGLSEHSQRYADIAHYLVGHGFAVYALDHQGHGKSEGRRVYISDFATYVDSVVKLINRVKEASPAAANFVIGHSMGGVIVTNLLIDYPGIVDGAILSGPALDTEEAVTPLQRRILMAIATIAPKLPVLQLDPTLVCRDSAVVTDYIEDPLVFSGKVPAGQLKQILTAAQRGLADASKITLPLLLLHGEEDGLAHPNGSRQLYDRVSSSDKELIVYPELYHEIFNESCKETIFKKITDWIDAHL